MASLVGPEIGDVWTARLPEEVAGVALEVSTDLDAVLVEFDCVPARVAVRAA